MAAPEAPEQALARRAGPAAGRSSNAALAAGRSRDAARCLWCGREVAAAGTVGRRRRYCAQACRQRAYENRAALQRGRLPVDAVVLSVDERNDLADRLYQVRCAAEDVATALTEDVGAAELNALVLDLLTAARVAERIR